MKTIDNNINKYNLLENYNNWKIDKNVKKSNIKNDYKKININNKIIYPQSFTSYYINIDDQYILNIYQCFF